MAENKGILPSSTFNTLGNNSNKWEAVYANKIVGPLTGNVTGNVSGSSSSCTGNAATATKATQDSAGQQINTTYIKGLSASNATLTYTKGNGTTGTVTVNNVATATNADKLDGYHYNDIIDTIKNVTSYSMKLPNWKAAISIDNTYTVPERGYIIFCDDSEDYFLSIHSNNSLLFNGILPVEKGQIFSYIYRGSANFSLYFLPCV